MEKTELGVENGERKANRVSGFVRWKNNLWSAYYGRPINDLKVILVLGRENRGKAAEMLGAVLRTSGQHTAVLVLEKPLKASILHKFFNDAWKAGANFVVVAADFEDVESGVFCNLPTYIVAVAEKELNDDDIDIFNWFCQEQKIEKNEKDARAAMRVIMPQEVKKKLEPSDLRDFEVLTYGEKSGADVRMNKAQFYKKGVEMRIVYGGETVDVATFEVGEEMPEVMAMVASVALAIGVNAGDLADGIAES